MSKNNQHTKMALITDVMDNTGLNRTQATAAVKAAYESIFTALTEGKEVRMDNIGTIYPKAMKERVRRNPATGETFVMPAHFTLAFRPSRANREHVDSTLQGLFELPTA
jgi:nucleoid DNA-binding protein